RIDIGKMRGLRDRGTPLQRYNFTTPGRSGNGARPIMVQGYYTLEEAAQILGMEADKLGQMAQRREIRAFADRGTWRFRIQDVEELGRRMGIGSDAELQMGESPSSKSSGKLPKVPKPKTGGDELFEFELSGSSEDLSLDLDDPGSARKK